MKIETAHTDEINIHNVVLEEVQPEKILYSDPIDFGFRVTAKDMKAMEKHLASYEQKSMSSFQEMEANMRILKGDLRSHNPKSYVYDFYALQYALTIPQVDMIRSLVLSPRKDRKKIAREIKSHHDFYFGWDSGTSIFALMQSARLMDEELANTMVHSYEKKGDFLTFLSIQFLKEDHYPKQRLDVHLAIKIAFPQYQSQFSPSVLTNLVNPLMQHIKAEEDWFGFARLAATLQLLRAVRIWAEDDGLHVEYEKPLETKVQNPLPVVRNF